MCPYFFPQPLLLIGKLALSPDGLLVALRLPSPPSPLPALADCSSFPLAPGSFLHEGPPRPAKKGRDIAKGPQLDALQCPVASGSPQMSCVDCALVPSSRATCLSLNQSRPQSLVEARALSTTAVHSPARTPSFAAFSMPAQDLKEISECTVDSLLSAFRARPQTPTASTKLR